MLNNSTVREIENLKRSTPYRSISIRIIGLTHVARRTLAGLWKRDILIWVPAWVVGVIGLLHGFGRTYPDSYSYVAWARFFADPNSAFIIGLKGLPLGSSTVIVASRLVVPFLASLLINWTSVSWSFGIVNSVFWIGGSLISYYIGKRLISRSFGLASATFYAASTPMLAYGSSIVTDPAGYFFIGLALYLGLSTLGGQLSSKRAFAEGSVMAISLLANPVGFAAFSYAATLRCSARRSLALFLAGAALVLAPVIILGVVTGLIGKLFDFWIRHKLIGASTPMTGGPALDALAWTFNVSAVEMIPINRLLAIFSMSLPVTIFFFVLTVLLGFIYLPQKRELFLYAPFLLAYVFLAHAWIERYLFCLWPLLLPAILVGLREVLLILGRVASRLIPQIRRRTPPILADPLFFVAVFLDVQALVNLRDYLGLSSLATLLELVQNLV